MGFLDHSTNNIIVDAVLTDMGRQRLSQNDGSFSIVKFALGDDEIDYTIIKKFGLTVGREKIEKNTPIFEAQTSNGLGLKYRLLSLSSQVQTQIPSLVNANGEVASAGENTLIQNGGNQASQQVTLTQQMGTGVGGIAVPIDMQESVFSIRASSRFLTLSSPGAWTPSYISGRDNMAIYRKSANVAGAPSIDFTISPKQTLNETIYNTYGNSSGIISTIVVVTGLLTGVQHNINVRLKWAN